jgi:hypothetical protein
VTKGIGDEQIFRALPTVLYMKYKMSTRPRREICPLSLYTPDIWPTSKIFDEAGPLLLLPGGDDVKKKRSCLSEIEQQLRSH